MILAPAYRHMRWFGPAVAAGIVSGVAGGLTLGLRATDALAASLALASCALLVRRRALVLACGIGAALMLAAAHGARARDRALGPPLAVWFAGQDRARTDEPVRIRGRLVEDAVPTPFGVRVRVDVEAILHNGAWMPMPGRVQLTVAGGGGAAARESWTAGRRLSAPALLRDPPVLMNPGGPGEAWQRLQRPFDVTGTVKSAVLVEVEPGAWWSEGAAAVRRFVRRAAARAIDPYAPDSTAIVTAILIGDRAGLDPDAVRRMQAAGTYHVIAISGGNVALLTALCFALLRLLVRGARAAALVTIIVVASYGAIVSGEPSVARAVLAAVIYLTLGLLGLAPGALHVVAFVALVLAAVDPLSVVDVGAWLSFGATVGIILGARRCSAWWTSAGPGLARAAGRAAAGLFGATLAAELTLLPVSALVFGRVGIAGLAVNFVAIPAMAVVQIAGAIAVALAGAADLVGMAGVGVERAASVAAGVAHGGVVVLTDSARLVDWAPALTWRTPPVSAVWAAAYYASWALVLVRPSGPWRRVGACGAVIASLILSTSPGLGRAGPDRSHLRVTLIDVGQGESILVQLPDGHSLLVDAGGGAQDVGRRAIVPALWALGVRRLDWLLVTHADLDHIVGARDVASAMRPREIWEGVPVSRDPARAALIEATRAGGIVWREVRAGDRLTAGAVTLEVLHPPPPDWDRPRVRNNDSVVVKLTYGRVDVLLTGDAADEFESRTMDAADPGRLRILKVAHHGSRTSSAETFLGAYRPDVALVSVGRGNLFSHPSPEVLARFEALRAALFRTDRDGAIQVTTDGRVVDVATARGGQFRLLSWVDVWADAARSR